MEPLYNGQIGDWPFVPCREVVPFLEVIIVSQNKQLAIRVDTVPGKAIEGQFCEGIPDQSPVWRDNVMAAGKNELARIKCGG